jgi:hypothetical protein
MTTYTQDQLTSREYTRPKLNAIAIDELGLHPDTVRLAATKREVIELILLAQDSETVGTEDQSHPEEPSYEYLEPVEEAEDADEVEAVEEAKEAEATLPWAAEPALEEAAEPVLQTSEQTYEERLLLFLDRNFRLDDDAEYLLRNFSNFKSALTALAPAPRDRPTRSATPRTRTTDPAGKLTQAKEVWDAVETRNGDYKAAAAAVGKSPHYTKMIHRAYALYQQSQVIQTAYDTGVLPWTRLYDIAFRNQVEKVGLPAIEAEVQAIAA